MNHFINNSRDASDFIKIKYSYEAEIIEKTYPFLATRHFLSLIDVKKYSNDPIYKQIFPSSQELDGTNLTEDPLGEEKQMPVPRLIHRYQDRVLVLVTDRCPVHCRFCFRKRRWKSTQKTEDISEKELEAILNYVSEHPNIKEIIISGGDPLMLHQQRLIEIINEFVLLKVGLIRIHSRMPAVLPSRIDKKLAKFLGSVPGLWFVAHLNHPVELTPQTIKVCDMLIKASVPMLSHTVLLKGINDDFSTLYDLFTKLIMLKIKPYYLFHVDPVTGARHFRTGIKKGLQIIKELRPVLSHHGVPSFAIDLGKGGGKVHLNPTYKIGNRFLAIDSRKIQYS